MTRHLECLTAFVTVSDISFCWAKLFDQCGDLCTYSGHFCADIIFYNSSNAQRWLVEFFPRLGCSHRTTPKIPRLHFAPRHKTTTTNLQEVRRRELLILLQSPPFRDLLASLRRRRLDCRYLEPAIVGGRRFSAQSVTRVLLFPWSNESPNWPQHGSCLAFGRVTAWSRYEQGVKQPSKTMVAEKCCAPFHVVYRARF